MAAAPWRGAGACAKSSSEVGLWGRRWLSRTAGRDACPTLDSRLRGNDKHNRRSAMPDYVPPSDAQFLLWAQAFAENLNLTPAAYMMSPAECANVQSVVDDFVAALGVATNENTRTKPTIIAKDNARSIAETLCRQYA